MTIFNLALWHTALLLLWREWRAGNIYLLFFSVVMATVIVTTVATLSERVYQSVVTESSSFLAADLRLQSPRDIPQEWQQQALQLNLETASVLTFTSMVFSTEQMKLASVKAVSSAYPLRGEVTVLSPNNNKATTGRFSPDKGTVWIEPRLQQSLNIALGDNLTVGNAEFTVAGILQSEPDRGSDFSALSFRVMMNLNDVEQTGVVQPGSRVSYHLLIAGLPDKVQQWSTWVTPKLSPSERMVSMDSDRPTIASALDRGRQFLMLAAELGVLLAGLAIAISAIAFAQRHVDSVALLKTLGSSAADITTLFFIALMGLAIVGGSIGLFIAELLQVLVVNPLAEGMGVLLPHSSLKPYILGVVTAVVAMAAFALPPVVALKDVSPVTVLRRNIEQKKLSLVWLLTPGFVGLAVIALAVTESWLLVGAFIAGLGVAAIILMIVIMVLFKGLEKIMNYLPGVWKLSVARLLRYRGRTALQILVYALITALIMTLWIARTTLVEQWQEQMPADTPNHFLINVSTDQKQALELFLQKEKIPDAGWYPMTRGRLTHINNEQVRTRVSKEDREQAGVERELNLTWSDVMPETNKLVAGKWWDNQIDDGVSIESKLAEKLNIKLGDTLRFQIGSESFTTPVSSIREVDWQTMRPNFYMIFPSGVLETYPVTWITSLRLLPEQMALTDEIGHRFPTVNIIDVRAVIDQVKSIIDQVSLAVEWVLWLVFFSGILVTLAAIQSTVNERKKEGALLRSFGMSSWFLIGSLWLEKALVGLLSGIVAIGTAEIMLYILQTRVFTMEPILSIAIWPVVLLGLSLWVSLVSVAFFFNALRMPTMSILREQELLES